MKLELLRFVYNQYTFRIYMKYHMSYRFDLCLKNYCDFSHFLIFSTIGSQIWNNPMTVDVSQSWDLKP